MLRPAARHGGRARHERQHVAVRGALHPRHRHRVAARCRSAAACSSPRSASCSTSPTSCSSPGIARSSRRSGCSSASSRSSRSAARYLGAQLQRAGAGKERLVAQLQAARLQADDILRNIRSGVITVDPAAACSTPTRRPSSCSASSSRDAHRRAGPRAASATSRPSCRSRSSARCGIEIRTTRGEGARHHRRAALSDRRDDDLHRRRRRRRPIARRRRSSRTSPIRSASTRCGFAPSGSRASPS